MRLFERFDLGRDAAQVVHVVVAVQQAPLLVCVDLEALAAARGADRQRLVVQVYGESPSIAAKTAARNSPLTVIGSSPLLRALLRKMSAKKLDTTTRNP